MMPAVVDLSETPEEELEHRFRNEAEWDELMDLDEVRP